MKIAITAKGPDLESKLDSRFGRSAWFVLVDPDGGEVEAVRNREGREDPDVHHSPPRLLLEHGAGVLLTGHCGSHAHHTLTAAGVEILAAGKGTVGEALASWRAGTLVPITAESAASNHRHGDGCHCGEGGGRGRRRRGRSHG